MATSPRTVLVVLDATHDDQLDSTAAELIGAAAPLGTPVVLTTNPAHTEARRARRSRGADH